MESTPPPDECPDGVAARATGRWAERHFWHAAPTQGAAGKAGGRVPAEVLCTWYAGPWLGHSLAVGCRSLLDGRVPCFLYRCGRPPLCNGRPSLLLPLASRGHLSRTCLLGGLGRVGLRLRRLLRQTPAVVRPTSPLGLHSVVWRPQVWRPQRARAERRGVIETAFPFDSTWTEPPDHALREHAFAFLRRRRDRHNSGSRQLGRRGLFWQVPGKTLWTFGSEVDASEEVHIIPRCGLL